MPNAREQLEQVIRQRPLTVEAKKNAGKGMGTGFFPHEKKRSQSRGEERRGGQASTRREH
jgi:hypothetical protein